MKYSWRTCLGPEGQTIPDQVKRVLLVSIECNNDTSRTPMLAPAYLVAEARRDPVVRGNVEFEIRQFSMSEPAEKILEELLLKRYDIVGFSCYVWNYHVYEHIVPLMKRLSPQTILVMGGPQLYGTERTIMNQLSDLDVVAGRAGETAFAKLVRYVVEGKRDWSDIGGIIFRSNGTIVDTLDKHEWRKFDDIASPYIEGVIQGQFPNMNLQTYRGCPHSCSYCIMGSDVEVFDPLSIERVRQDLGKISGLGAHTLGFFDATFNHPPSRSRAILDAISEFGQFKTVGVSLYVQTLDDDLARNMARFRTEAGIGLQTCHPEAHRLMRRRLVLDRLISGVQIMNKYGMQYSIQIIVGLPGDTYESIARTLLFTVALEPPLIDSFRLMVLPGTDYRNRAEELGIVYESRPYHYIISHFSMNHAEINRAERMAQTLSIFYNCRATRKEIFEQAEKNGETIIDFCDALGVYIENFSLIDREELRKGEIIRSYDDQTLQRILSDFIRFRTKLAIELALAESHLD
ncbi:MAG: B12-binding domain-containing radical SAM protein [Candidatus Zixiibacteriota bacterium]